MLNPWCSVIFFTINIFVNNRIYDSVLCSVFTTAISFVNNNVVRGVELQGTHLKKKSEFKIGAPKAN
jgi:hypothetical protein